MESPNQTEPTYYGYLSSREASGRFRLTNDYIARLCRNGKIKGVLLGKVWFVEEASLVRFIEEGSKQKVHWRKNLSQQRREEYVRREENKKSPEPPLAHALKTSLWHASVPVAMLVSRVRSVAPLGFAILFACALGALASMQTSVARYADAIPTTTLRVPPQSFSVQSVIGTAYDPASLKDALTPDTQVAVLWPNISAQELSAFGSAAFKVISPYLPSSQVFASLPPSVPSVAESVPTNSARTVASLSSFYARVQNVFSQFDSAPSPSMLSAVASTYSSAASAISGFSSQWFPAAHSDITAFGRAFQYLATLFSGQVPGLATTSSTSATTTPVLAVAQTVPMPVPRSSSSGAAAAPTIMQTFIQNGVSQESLSAQLSQLQNAILSQVYSVTATPAAGGLTQSVAISQRINTLQSVAIGGSTITGGSISGASGSFTSLTDSGALSVDGNSSLGDVLFVDAVNHRVNIGTTSSQYMLNVNGNVNVGDLTVNGINVTNLMATTSTFASLTVTGTGDNMVLSTDGTGNVISTSTPSLASIFATSTTATSTFAGGVTMGDSGFVFQQATGNVGIGTSSPFASLSVQGNGFFDGNVTGSNLTATGTLAVTGNTTLSNATSTSSFFTPSLLANVFAAGQTGTTTILSNGNVGIGTSSPFATLSVQGNGFFDGNVTGSNLTATGTLAIAGNTTLSGTLAVTGNTTLSNATSTSSFFTPSLLANVFAAGQTGTTSITSAGFLSVGSTTPWGLLSVNANGLPAGTPQFVVGSSTATNFMVANNGNVGIGTTTPTSLLDLLAAGGAPGANGTTPAGLIKLRSLNGTGALELGMNAIGTTYAWLQAHDVTNQATNNPLALNPNGGNVGVGTTSPGAMLAVDAQNSQLNEDGLAVEKNFFGGGVGSAAASIGGYDIGTSEYGILVGVKGSGGFGTNTSYPLEVLNNGAAAFVVDSTGNVGVGASSPLYRLDVSGTGHFSNTLTLSTILSCTGSQAIQTDASGDLVCGTISGTSGVSSAAGWKTDNVGDVTLATTTDSVGIGATTTPYAKFTILSGNTGTTTLALIPTPAQTAHVFDIYDNLGNLASVFTADNKFGIGSTSPMSKLALSGASNINLSFANTTDSALGSVGVNDANATVDLSSLTNNDVRILTDSIERFRILGSNGNVGIGTSSPFATLSVQGNGFFDGNVTGSNLTATGTLAIAGNTTLSGTLAVTGNTTLSNATSTSSFFTPSLLANVFAAGQTGTTSITSAGFLSVGSTTPWGLLSVNANGLPAGTPQFVVGSSTATNFMVANNGNVGIGTSSPFATLSVQGNGFFDGNVTGSNLTATGTLAIAGNTTLSGTLAVTGNTTLSNATSTSSFFTPSLLANVFAAGQTGTTSITSAGFLSVGSTTPWGLLSVNANGLPAGTPQFVVGSSTATNFMVANNGNVGIGTSSPFATLSVQGNGFFDGNVTGSNLTATGTLTVQGTATSTFAGPIASASGNLIVAAAGTTNELLLNPYGGGVGIGTTSPTSGMTLAVQQAVSSSQAQLMLAYDNTRYADLQVLADGSLNFSNNVSNTINMLNNNLFVCTGGACPNVPGGIVGTGNLEVGGTLFASTTYIGGFKMVVNPSTPSVLQIFNISGSEVLDIDQGT